MECLQNKKLKILLIVEGTKAEPVFFNRLAQVYGLNAEIYPVGTNLYLLYKKMKEYNFESDVKDALKELSISKADKEILSNKFAYTYLIFDCDIHHRDIVKKDVPLEVLMRENFLQLKEMASYFVDETDPSIGRLYVNYPMMESYKDCDNFFDEKYLKNRVLVEDLIRYKSIVGSKKLCNVRVDSYDKENFNDLINLNLHKLNYMIEKSSDSLPYKKYLEISEASKVADYEFTLVEEENCIDVLNTSIFLLLDYYGNRDGFYDNIAK